MMQEHNFSESNDKLSVFCGAVQNNSAKDLLEALYRYGVAEGNFIDLKRLAELVDQNGYTLLFTLCGNAAPQTGRILEEIGVDPTVRIMVKTNPVSGRVFRENEFLKKRGYAPVEGKDYFNKEITALDFFKMKRKPANMADTQTDAIIAFLGGFMARHTAAEKERQKRAAAGKATFADLLYARGLKENTLAGKYDTQRQFSYFFIHGGRLDTYIEEEKKKTPRVWRETERSCFDYHTQVKFPFSSYAGQVKMRSGEVPVSWLIPQIIDCRFEQRSPRDYARPFKVEVGYAPDYKPGEDAFVSHFVSEVRLNHFKKVWALVNDYKSFPITRYNIRKKSLEALDYANTEKAIIRLSNMGFYSLPLNMGLVKKTIAGKRRAHILNSFPGHEREQVAAYLQLHAPEELRRKIKTSIPAVAEREDELRVCLRLMDAERRAGIRFRIHTQQMEAVGQTNMIAAKFNHQGR
jgi:hypothetical protein